MHELSKYMTQHCELSVLLVFVLRVCVKIELER